MAKRVSKKRDERDEVISGLRELVETLEQQLSDDERQHRSMCLDMAVRLSVAGSTTAPDVVKTAEQLYAFVMGTRTAAPVTSGVPGDAA